MLQLVAQTAEILTPTAEEAPSVTPWPVGRPDGGALPDPAISPLPTPQRPLHR